MSSSALDGALVEHLAADLADDDVHLVGNAVALADHVSDDPLMSMDSTHHDFLTTI
jgi:hypothetical protein